MGKLWKQCAGLCMMASAGPGWADLPLMLEELLTEEKTVKLHFGVTYNNSLQKTSELYNLDQAISRFGIRYGATSNTEVYSRITGACSETRIGRTEEIDHANACQWRNLVAGVNHRFSPENDTPALLGFIETELIENVGFSNTQELVNGKTWHAGLTAYRSIDPIVLSLTAGYNYTAPRKIASFGALGKIDTGDTVYLEPSLSFAANDQVSIFGGFRLNYRNKKRIDQSRVRLCDHYGDPSTLSWGLFMNKEFRDCSSIFKNNMPTTRTDLLSGVSFAPTEKLTLHSNVRVDISGDTGSSVGIDMTYQL